MKPIEFFARDVHTLWATTYQLDLKLFDQFLLRRLGSAPLNAVVLCDEESLTDTLRGLSELDMHVAANANRRYVLRGIRLASGGRFHPKTYFFAGRRGITLLVGSGNLTQTGLDRGLETFVRFDATDDEGLAALRAWSTWVRQLLDEHGDPVLQRRFTHLQSAVPELVGPPASSDLLTNAVEPLLSALARRAPQNVAEAHVCAPFYDENARALGALIEQADPDSLHLYLRPRTSVDGNALRAVLDAAACEVELHSFDPPDFVHAKLVGLIDRSGQGVLLCGSPNLSQAALTRTYSDPHSAANCEVAVMRQGTAELVRAAFRPPRHNVVEVPIEAVEELHVEREEPRGPPWPVRLRRALRIAAHLQLEANGDLTGLRVAWDDAPTALSIESGGRTADPLDEDASPLIVWVVDEEGNLKSNPVVVDDERALEAMLGEGESRRDRPPELEETDDDSGLVALLKRAHQRFIFDVDETPAMRRAANAQEQQRGTDDIGFWERYARGELASDPRSETYRPIGSTRRLTETDQLLQEIEAMLRAAPGERPFRPDGDATDGREGEPAVGQTWSFRARERVRAQNLLRRWARALGDPRQAWIVPHAPAVNYEVLLGLLSEIWLGDALPEEAVIALLGEVWTALLGSHARRGLLDRADRDVAAEVLASISDDARDLGAGLAFCALHNELPWKSYVYEWQPFLIRGIDDAVFRPGLRAVNLALGLWAGDWSKSEIERALHDRASWIDDETWGRRLAAELDLASIHLVRQAGHKGVSTVVDVRGLVDPWRDPRLITVARRAMAFRSSNHVLIRTGTGNFLVRLGEVLRAVIDGKTRESIVPIDAQRLAGVERQHGTLDELLGSRTAA